MSKNLKRILMASASLLMFFSVGSSASNVSAKSNSSINTQITKLRARKSNLQRRENSYNRIIKSINAQLNKLEHQKKQSHKSIWHKGTPKVLQGSWRSRSYAPKHLSKNAPKAFFYNYIRVAGKRIYAHYLNNAGDFNLTNNISYYRINRSTYKLVGNYSDTSGKEIKGVTMYIHLLPHNHINVSNYVPINKKHKRAFNKRIMKMYLYRTSHNDISSNGASLLGSH